MTSTDIIKHSILKAYTFAKEYTFSYDLPLSVDNAFRFTNLYLDNLRIETSLHVYIEDHCVNFSRGNSDGYFDIGINKDKTCTYAIKSEKHNIDSCADDVEFEPIIDELVKVIGEFSGS